MTRPREYYERIGRLGGSARARKLGKRRRRQIAKMAAKASIPARLQKVPPERRTAIARNAAIVRWVKRSGLAAS